jgi:hypothetical protein
VAAASDGTNIRSVKIAHQEFRQLELGHLIVILKIDFGSRATDQIIKAIYRRELTECRKPYISVIPQNRDKYLCS